jgi:hypothetical protein
MEIEAEHGPLGAIVCARRAVGGNGAEDFVAGADLDQLALGGDVVEAAVPVGDGPLFSVVLEHGLENALGGDDVFQAGEEIEQLAVVSVRDWRHGEERQQRAV